MVDFHPNIVGFCGVTKLKGNNNYCI